MSTLKQEESCSTLEINPGTSTLEIFECALRFRSTFKYATSDFTSISQSLRALKGLPATRLLKSS